MTKYINMARRSGKTTLLIHSSFVTGAPIIVIDTARKKNVLDQAKEQGLDIRVYTIREWNENRQAILNQTYTGVFIDEAEEVIEKALEYYLGTRVIAYTVSQPMIERNKKEE